MKKTLHDENSDRLTGVFINEGSQNKFDLQQRVKRMINKKSKNEG